MIEPLLASLWQGAFIVAVAAGITTFVPRRHASTRYAVWFVSLIALFVLPFLGQVSFGVTSSPILVLTTRAVSEVTQETSSAGGSWIGFVWSFGILVCAARIAASSLRLSRILRAAVPAPHIGDRVFVSSLVFIPVAAGLRQPAIIIPGDLADALSRHDLEAILAHERAHIARHDILGNVIQRIIESLLFFNPWVYVIGRQLVKEREAACDDWAVCAGSDPGSYAACLATLGLRTPGLRTSLLTPSAIWPERMLVGRIARLLNGKAIQVKTNYPVVAAAVALFALLSFGFQSPSSVVAATRCSSDVRVLHAAAPDIPPSAAKAHPRAEVTLAVTVSKGGHASNIDLVKSSGNATIDDAVANAAAHSTYKPAFRNCNAVSGGKYMFRAELGP